VPRSVAAQFEHEWRRLLEVQLHLAHEELHHEPVADRALGGLQEGQRE
jgi:hypothetical protein